MIASAKSFSVRLAEWGGMQIATGASFDDTGTLTKAHLVLSEDKVQEIVTKIAGQKANVDSKKTRPFTENPKAPFITSTLQQEAIEVAMDSQTYNDCGSTIV